MMRVLAGAIILLAGGLAAAQGTDRAKDAARKQPAFQVSEFKITVEKYSLLGRGIVRVDAAELKNRAVALRLRYALRLKRESFVYTSSAWVVMKDGAGLLEITAFVPEAIASMIREEKDYPMIDWSVEGWIFMNPGTISNI